MEILDWFFMWSTTQWGTAFSAFCLLLLASLAMQGD